MTARLLVCVLVLVPASAAWAWCEDGRTFCRCPGEVQCLGEHASCEEACGLTSSSAAPASQPYQPSAAELAAQEHQRLKSLAIDTNNQGVAAQQRGDWPGAIALYEQALRIDPDNDIVRGNLARARVSYQWQQDVEAARRQNEELERRNRVLTDQHNVTASRIIAEYVAGLAVPLAALNEPAAPSLEFLSRVPDAPVCSDVVAESAETLRWADQQAKEQGWSFFRDSAGITGALEDAKQGAIRKAGAEDYQKVLQATQNCLEQARGFKAFMDRVSACVGQEPGTRKGCLVALAAEKSEQPAKEWLKDLLGRDLRGGVERAEKAGKIYRQYAERLQAAAQKQALAAASCQP